MILLWVLVASPSVMLYYKYARRISLLYKAISVASLPPVFHLIYTSRLEVMVHLIQPARELIFPSVHSQEQVSHLCVPLSSLKKTKFLKPISDTVGIASPVMVRAYLASWLMPCIQELNPLIL